MGSSGEDILHSDAKWVLPKVPRSYKSGWQGPELVQSRTIRYRLIRTKEHNVAVFIIDATHQDLRLKASNSARREVHNCQDLTTDKSLRRVVNRDLSARLANPIFTKIYPQLDRRLAGFWERFGSNDRSHPKFNFLEIRPLNHVSAAVGV